VYDVFTFSDFDNALFAGIYTLCRLSY